MHMNPNLLTFYTTTIWSSENNEWDTSRVSPTINDVYYTIYELLYLTKHYEPWLLSELLSGQW